MKSAEDILNYEIGTGRSPSVQYHIFDKEKILYSFSKGFSRIAEQKHVDTQTTYNAFSVTKTFTALAVLQLVESEKIAIDDPVIKHLPYFQYGNEITVKQLLSHSAGIPNPIPLAWVHLEDEHHSFDRDAFFTPILEKNNKPRSGPNEKFAYSNLGYVIAGQLIEKISGKTYEEYITENILQKLNIGKSDLAFTLIDNQNHAKGYHKRNSLSNLVLGFFMDRSKFMERPAGKWCAFRNFYVNGASYGGLIGKPTAFIHYIRELLKDDSILISKDLKTVLLQENRNNKGKNTGMCLSWFTGELFGNKYLAHAGGGGGYYCEIRLYPDINMGSVIFFNRTGMTDERYLDKLDKFFIQTHQ